MKRGTTPTNIENLQANKAKVRSLEKALLDKMNAAGIPYVRNGGEHTLPGIISLSFDGKDGEAIPCFATIRKISVDMSATVAYNIFD